MSLLHFVQRWILSLGPFSPLVIPQKRPQDFNPSEINQNGNFGTTLERSAPISLVSHCELFLCVFPEWIQSQRTFHTLCIYTLGHTTQPLFSKVSFPLCYDGLRCVCACCRKDLNWTRHKGQLCAAPVLFQMSERQDDMFSMHCAQVISQNVVRNKSFVAIGFLAVEFQF